MSFLDCWKGEYLKTKGTFSFWLVLLGGALVPFISFLIQLFKPEYFITRAANPWGAFIGDIFSTAVPLLLPFFLIIVIALNFSIEHKSNAWKKLFVVPHKRITIYSSKVFLILFQVLLSLLVFALSIVIFGYLLGVIHPELNFLETTIGWTHLIKSLVKTFIAYLALISFQLVLSFFFKNFIVPIGIGLFGFIVGIMLTKWEYLHYNFLSNNYSLSKHLGNKVIFDFTFGLPTYLVFSVVYFALFITIGWLLFNRRAL